MITRYAKYPQILLHRDATQRKISISSSPFFGNGFPSVEFQTRRNKEDLAPLMCLYRVRRDQAEDEVPFEAESGFVIC